jgi:hypothetical protein
MMSWETVEVKFTYFNHSSGGAKKCDKERLICRPGSRLVVCKVFVLRFPRRGTNPRQSVVMRNMLLVYLFHMQFL